MTQMFDILVIKESVLFSFVIFVFFDLFFDFAIDCGVQQRKGKMVFRRNRRRIEGQNRSFDYGNFHTKKKKNMEEEKRKKKWRKKMAEKDGGVFEF